MKRTATCSCEQLTITVRDEAKYVIACSCTKCQKRTGSVLGVVAYFPDASIVSKSGKYNTYKKISAKGTATVRNFCPNCGSSVYWQSEFLPQHTGVAVGSFADPAFPSPQMSAWERYKPAWLSLPETIPCSQTQEFE
jgi:hypothetical protein